MRTEKELLKEVIKWLNQQPHTYVLRICDMYHIGYPDIVCCANGKFLALELKAPNGIVSAHQRATARSITNANGIAAICYTLGQVQEAHALCLI